MQKVTQESGQSANIINENIAQIKALFPDACTENGVDFDTLRQLLGDVQVLDQGEEKYGLNWHGKRLARQISLLPSGGTLLPKKEESLNWDDTNNLFIEGDNLEALKLLQKSYPNSFKIIYIDPPYNTGEELIYPDKFQDNLDTYLRYTGQIDGDGLKLSSKTENSGRKHTSWLSMMLPRLRLAKSLLHAEGAIFISIDDEEVSQLRLLCDEVFGQENFLNCVSVNMKNIAGASGGGEDKRLKKNVEYLLIYCKDYSTFSQFNNVFDYIPLEELVETYREEGKSWKYTTILKDAGTKNYIASTVDGDGNEIRIFRRDDFKIASINQVMSEEGLSEAEAYRKYASLIFQTAMPQSSIRPRVMAKVQEIGDSGDLYSIEYTPKSGRNKGVVYEQFYKGDSFRLFAWLRDVSEEIDGQLFKKEMKGTYWDFASETKNLSKEGGIAFPNGKKPLRLVQRILEMQQDKDCMVLDFFAGSATTGHAVYAQNLEDGGKRRFVLVQLPETIEPTDDLAKQGFANIAQVARERLRRAVSRIREDHESTDIDLGFKTFALAASCRKEWNPDKGDLEKTLLGHSDSIMPGRSETDILFELLLRRGVDLAAPIDERVSAGKTIFSVGNGVLFACLATAIDIDEIETIAKSILDWHKELQPETDTHVFFRDSAFADDIAKTNMAAILEQNGISHVRSL